MRAVIIPVFFAVVAAGISSCGDGVPADVKRRIAEENARERALQQQFLEERIARIDGNPTLYRDAIRQVLAASNSDFEAGPQEQLIDEALRLFRADDCDLDDLKEWGWTRAQLAGAEGTYFTYCNQVSPLRKHSFRPAAD